MFLLVRPAMVWKALATHYIIHFTTRCFALLHNCSIVLNVRGPALAVAHAVGSGQWL
jgi:hypothetical protein